MDRRSFLVGSVTGVGALALAPRALAEDAVYHVLYPGSATAGQAHDLLAQIAAVLGPGVSARLRVVERGGDAVVVFDRSGLPAAADRAAAAAVALRHDGLLREAFDEDRVFATVVASSLVDATWNVRYGSPGPEASQRRTFAEVSRILGPGVAKSLVVEALPDGTFQVVYARRGDAVGTAQIAAHHARLLRGVGLDATAVPDAFAAPSFDATTADAATLDAPDVDALLADEAPDLPEAVASAEPEAAEVTEPLADEGRDTGDDEPGTGPHPPPACYDDRPSLQARINAHVQALRARGLVSSVERTSWLVHDLVADRTLCAINADTPLQAASMIKPFVALAFFHLVDQGKLVYGDLSRLHLERMIRDSSNPSTNWMIERVGGPSACQALLRRHYRDLAQGVSVVEYIPSSGCTYENLASAWDHARLLIAMWRDEVPYARELRRVMNLPGRDRLYCDVPEIPPGTEVYNKTGTTAMCCGDMGVLVARTHDDRRVPYVIVGIIERASRTSRYTAWSQARSDVIRQVSGLTYAYLRQIYGLA